MLFVRQEYNGVASDLSINPLVTGGLTGGYNTPKSRRIYGMSSSLFAADWCAWSQHEI